MDYLGINLYFPKRVRSPRYEWNKETPFHPEYYYEEFSLPGRRMNTSRGWEIYPQIMYDMAMRLKSEYGNIPWFIAESGMGIEQEERFLKESQEEAARQRIDAVIPPADRLPVAIALTIAAMAISYLMVKGTIMYTEWRQNHRTGEVIHDV